MSEPIYETRHMCLSIAGALRNYARRKMTGLMQDENDRDLSDKECRAYLAECLNKGWKVIPMGECDNFDYQTGCKGHKSTKEKYEATKA